MPQAGFIGNENLDVWTDLDGRVPEWVIHPTAGDGRGRLLERIQ